jgi:hypothetical protein
VQDWIRQVNDLREGDPLLARGHWHGYTENYAAFTPMRGHLYLVRWNQPTVAVSHDDPEEVVRLARAIEAAL